MSRYSIRNRNESEALWTRVDGALAVGKTQQEMAAAMGYSSAHAFAMCYKRRGPIAQWRREMLHAVASGVPVKLAFETYAPLEIQAQPSRHKKAAEQVGPSTVVAVPCNSAWGEVAQAASALLNAIAAATNGVPRRLMDARLRGWVTTCEDVVAVCRGEAL